MEEDAEESKEVEGESQSDLKSLHSSSYDLTSELKSLHSSHDLTSPSEYENQTITSQSELASVSEKFDGSENEAEDDQDENGSGIIPWSVRCCGGEECNGTADCIFIDEFTPCEFCRGKYKQNCFIMFRLCQFLHKNRCHLLNYKPDSWRPYIDRLYKEDEIFARYRKLEASTIYVHFDQALKEFIRNCGLIKFQNHSYVPGFTKNLPPKHDLTPYEKLFCKIYYEMDEKNFLEKQGKTLKIEDYTINSHFQSLLREFELDNGVEINDDEDAFVSDGESIKSIENEEAPNLIEDPVTMDSSVVKDTEFVSISYPLIESQPSPQIEFISSSTKPKPALSNNIDENKVNTSEPLLTSPIFPRNIRKRSFSETENNDTSPEPPMNPAETEVVSSSQPEITTNPNNNNREKINELNNLSQQILRKRTRKLIRKRFYEKDLEYQKLKIEKKIMKYQAKLETKMIRFEVISLLQQFNFHFDASNGEMIFTKKSSK